MASIRQRGEHSYQIIVSRGYDSAGKKLTSTKTITLDPGLTEKQTKKELERQVVSFEKQVEDGTYLDGSKITFAEFIGRWLKDYAEKQLEPKTLARYKEMLDSRIVPALGHIKLNRLQPTHLIEFYGNLEEEGIRLDKKYIATPDLIKDIRKRKLTFKKLADICRVSDKTISSMMKSHSITSKSAKLICKALDLNLNKAFTPKDSAGTLSGRTVLHHHRVISSILTCAVQWQVIPSNPADRVKPPKVDRKIPQHYNQKQAKELIAALADEPIKYRMMVILDSFTGFRLGELMGLNWADIDFEAKTVTINTVSQYVVGMGTFTKDKPKNDHSVRTLSVPPFVVAMLKQYKSWWNEQKLSCGNLWQNSDRLFVTWDGRPMYTYTLTNWLPLFLKKHTLEKLTPHGLRHTFASLLAKKIPIPELANLLGHARPSTTSDIYVHFIEDTGEGAGDMLEEMLIDHKDSQKKQG